MPELRKEVLMDRWVIFSPERLRRPMHFHLDTVLDEMDEANPFLAGRESYTAPEVFALRENGSAANQPGWRVRVVPNRFPALRIEGDLTRQAVGFYDKITGIGAHEVIIETPDPALDLELQPITGIADVLTAWRSRCLDLAKDNRFRYLALFKNHGVLAGASLPHPHSQVVGLPIVPALIREKLATAKRHYDLKERNIFEDILQHEREQQVRMVYENAGFSAFCPFASRFPFEVSIMPRKQSADFPSITDHDLVLLADVLKRVLTAYRVGLKEPSYNLVVVTAPLRRVRQDDATQTIDLDFRWHIELLPRIGGVAGFELGTGYAINPIYPEDAAKFLREVENHV